MGRLSLRPLLVAMTALTLLVIVAGSALALPCYVIKRNSFSFDLWDIAADGRVSFQLTSPLTFAQDPVGVAIDAQPSWEATLFVTSEFMDVIEFIDAATLQRHGSVTAPGASDLAGIAADGSRNIIYAVDRGRATLYAYDWDYTAQSLTLRAGFPRALVNCAGAYGLALDEGRGVLYVADGGAGRVRGYDVSTWAEVVSYAPPLSPVGIAVDGVRGCVYSTQPAGGCAAAPDGNTLLCKYDLSTGTQSSVNMGHGGMGVAVDENTGFVYVTAGCDVDDISVWNTSVSPWVNIQQPPTGPLFDPAGIAIPRGRAPLVYPFRLDKDDHQTCALPSQTLTYDLCFDNTLNPTQAGSNVVLSDFLPPELVFQSATDGGVYFPATRKVVWSIGTLPAGAPRQCFHLVAQVIPTFGPGGSIRNVAEITGGVAGSTFTTTYPDLDELCPCTTPTTVELISDPNPSSVGALVTFTATVMAGGAPAGDATGTMTFLVADPGAPAVDVPVAGGTAVWATASLALGQHVVTAEYSGDGVKYCDSTSRGLTQDVIINRPPDCRAAAASISELWPPNHRMVNVDIVGVIDPDGDPVTITIMGISQDEPVNGLGDGDTAPDGAGVGTSTAQVRAERAGTPRVPGNGRVYMIAFKASDGRGGECGQSVAVCVPHDQRRGHVCVDDGQNYVSTGPSGPSPAARGGQLGIRYAPGRSTGATFEYSLERDSHVNLSVFDVAGRRVVSVVNGQQAAGTHTAQWSTVGLPSGIYWARIRTSEYTDVKKLIVRN